MHGLDQLDLEILRILQTNGRMPITKLSARLEMPHATVRDRIRKMEEAGVIEGYRAVINAKKVGFLISGYVQLTLDQRIEIAPAIETLQEIEEVTEVHVLTGDIDAFVRIWARDVEHLREILYEKFNDIPGMVRTSTAVILAGWDKPMPLPNEEPESEQ